MLPARQEWRAEHLTALINVLSEIRAEMAPAVPEQPPAPHEVESLHDPRYVTREFSGGTQQPLPGRAGSGVAALAALDH